MDEAQAEAIVLDVKGLRTVFFTNSGLFRAVEDVSFTVRRGETLAIVGESGCGKSVTALSIMRLVPDPPGRIVGGSVVLEGTDLLALDESEMRKIRGNRISMIFQEPMTSLNPVLTIGFQIAEALIYHRGLDRRAAEAETLRILERVRVPAARQRLHEYPHRFSGGMRQRVMIAMALACKPKLLIADEPTTALDVTIQAQILDLLRRLKDETGMGLIIITHDMGVVAETADRVIVQYAGEQVEKQSTRDLFREPRHPYTAALLAALPERAAGGERLPAIPGVVPGQFDRPEGCLFSPRCQFVFERCHTERPGPASGELGQARCHTPLVGGRPLARAEKVA